MQTLPVWQYRIGTPAGMPPLMAADPAPQLDARQSALVQLGRWLRLRDYRHTCITPASHRHVYARKALAAARSLRDIFGWSLPFREADLPEDAFALLREGGGAVRDGNRWRSTLRFSTLGELLLAHSAYPTIERDAVFLGPDSHRFAQLIRRTLSRRSRPANRIVDVGCGSGVAGLAAAQVLALDQPRLLLADINPAALRLAEVNAALAGQDHCECLHSDALAAIEGPADLILCNPPYLMDEAGRRYRDGGAPLGCGLALRVLREALDKLAPGGQLILYTGSPMVDGEDLFLRTAMTVAGQDGFAVEYEELDPDVFGEELQEPAYRDVERIAAVGLVVTRN